MPDWVNIFGKKEDINQVKHIFVVDIKDFIDKYKLDPKQKKKLICNHLNQWLKRRNGL
jgi:F0F1-type ATP synthase delta subunit